VIAVPDFVYLAVYWACLGLALWALVDAVTRRADAFVAAGKLTKPVWLGILAGGLVAQIVFPALGGSMLSILGMAGIVASIVYLVDVRKRILEVMRGGSRW
jgi:hypothetical protein